MENYVPRSHRVGLFAEATTPAARAVINGSRAAIVFFAIICSVLVGICAISSGLFRSMNSAPGFLLALIRFLTGGNAFSHGRIQIPI